MERERDEFDGQGGSYEIRDGKRVRVTEPTKDHPEGNRPRDKDGKPLGVATEAAPAEEAKPTALASVKPIGGAKRGPQADD